MTVAYLRISTEKQHLEESARRDIAFRRFARSACRTLGNGGRERAQERQGAQAGQCTGTHEARRYVGRYGVVAAQPNADRNNVYHGNVSRTRDSPVQHEVRFRLRRLDQQQGTLLRIRPRRRDRAQPDIDAHARGAGSTARRGCGARAQKGTVRQAAVARTSSRRDYGDAAPRYAVGRDMPRVRAYRPRRFIGSGLRTAPSTRYIRGGAAAGMLRQSVRS